MATKTTASYDDSTTHQYTYEGKPLSELSSWELEDSDQDIRGWRLYANPSKVLGTIDDMLVDKDAEIVSAVRLDNGQMYAAKDLTIGDNVVYLKTMAAPKTPFVKVYDV